MSDIQLNASNDFDILDGQLYLTQTREELVQQRLLNRLRTFTGDSSLFTNINYGLNSNLIGARGTRDALATNIKTLITTTPDILRLVSYTDNVDSATRTYFATFTAETVTGEIVGIGDIPVGGTLPPTQQRLRIWRNGVWNNDGYWHDDTIWGSGGSFERRELKFFGDTLLFQGDTLTFNREL